MCVCVWVRAAAVAGVAYVPRSVLSRCDSGAGCKVMAHRHAVNIQGLSRLVAVAATAAAMANAFYSVRC